jgi:hypothetical protein
MGRLQSPYPCAYGYCHFSREEISELRNCYKFQQPRIEINCRLMHEVVQRPVNRCRVIAEKLFLLYYNLK